MKYITDNKDEPSNEVFFGGPDCSPRKLRDLLAAHIKAVPSGGEIHWVTYYFRDEELARELVLAHNRGVSVWVDLEKKPRTRHANQKVAEIFLRAQGLNSRYRQISHLFPDNYLFKKPRLHEKIYYFSHPYPHVLLGSFNPSSNRPEDFSIISEIGDQDQDHNFLVQFNNDYIVGALKSHMQYIHTNTHGPWERLFSSNNQIIQKGDTRIYLFPCRRRGILKKYLNAIPANSIIRVAVSHMNDFGMARLFCSLVNKGVHIEMIAHASHRRVPLQIERKLRQKNIRFHRYLHPQGTSTHNKFILVENERFKQVIFGSMNLSSRSLHANHELLVFSENPSFFEEFYKRWDKMAKDINDFSK